MMKMGFKNYHIQDKVITTEREVTIVYEKPKTAIVFDGKLREVKLC